MTEPTPCCITCGYSLANIDREGVCPECATPVPRSLSVNHLHDSSVEYLITVRRGVYLQIGAVVAVIVASLLRAMATNPSAARAVSLVSLGCSLISVLGAWFISSTDPARSADEKFGKLLSRCRAWALTDAGAQCAGVLFGIFVGGARAATVTGLSQIPAFVTLIYVAKIFADLGARAGDTKLLSVANQLVKVSFWILGGSVALVLVELVLVELLPGQSLTGRGTRSSLFVPVLGMLILFLVRFLVRYVESIVRILKALRAAITHAHEDKALRAAIAHERERANA